MALLVQPLSNSPLVLKVSVPRNRGLGRRPGGSYWMELSWGLDNDRRVLELVEPFPRLLPPEA